MGSARVSLTLKDFAQASGVITERCSKEWGGTWAYKISSEPTITYCGFRTEAELYSAWAQDTFGSGASKALLALLLNTPRSSCGKARINS